MKTPHFLPQEIIRRKRDGHELDAADIDAFISGLTDGTVSEGQAAAFAMAILFRGMNGSEQVALTNAMKNSGETLSWDEHAPIVDKHSTGGVGDKVSLILAPMAAAAGAMVPMISGRGLGHTGGTLDKLEAIPGYNTTPASNDLIRIVNEVGCAIIGQTGQLAPADGRLYAIRDVTATVESTPLITASILSKKMAAGLKGLVMDVKWGSGAFMATRSDAKELAKNISQVATKGGMPTAAFITDMNQVLGHSAGNALEVLEAIEFLTGTRADPRLKELCTTLVGEMLCLVDLAKTPEQGLEMAEETLTNGSAAEKFASMVAALNGPKDLITRPAKYLEAAPVIHAATAKQTGFVTKVDVRALGNSIVKLGGGRIHPAQKIDHRVGLSEVCPIGHEITTDQPLCLIHGADSDTAKAVADEISDAFQIAAHPPSPAPIIADRVGPFDT